MSNEQLIKEVESTLDSAKSKVAKLSNRMTANFDSAAETTKNQLQEKVKILDAKRSELEAKLADLRKSTSDASEDVVVGVKMAWNDLKSTVNSVGDRF